MKSFFLHQPAIIRFIKFGAVGSSGVIVNLLFLYLGQEFIFRFITPDAWRLNSSLVLAISIAMLNNFLLNWAWTWRDRKSEQSRPDIIQFIQYILACSLGIILQIAITKIMANHIHYLLANLTAIGIASLANFAINDRVTFQIKKAWKTKGQAVQ